MLAVPALAGTGAASGTGIPAALVAIGKTAATAILLFLGARFVVPRLLHLLAGTQKKALFVVAVLFILFGTSLAAAWAVYRPEAKRPIRAALPQPPYNGWEERHLYRYEVSPNEKMAVYALAIAASRLVLLAHHPSDVVAGGLLGVIGAMAVRYWFAVRRLGFAIRDHGEIVPR